MGEVARNYTHMYKDILLFIQSSPHNYILHYLTVKFTSSTYRFIYACIHALLYTKPHGPAHSRIATRTAIATILRSRDVHRIFVKEI